MKVWVSLNSPELVDEGYTGKRGVYVFVTPLPESIDKLSALAEKLGFEPKPTKYHVTLMYSKVPARSTPTVMPQQTHHSVVDNIEAFEGHDGKTYLVANLASKDLRALHSKWKDAGAEHTYTPFKPHITIWAGVDMTEQLANTITHLNAHLMHKPMVISFDGETATDLKDD